MVKSKRRKQKPEVKSKESAARPAVLVNMDVQKSDADDYRRVLCPACGGRPTVYKTINYSIEVTIRGLRCGCGWRGKHTEDHGTSKPAA